MAATHTYEVRLKGRADHLMVVGHGYERADKVTRFFQQLTDGQENEVVWIEAFPTDEIESIQELRTSNPDETFERPRSQSRT